MHRPIVITAFAVFFAAGGIVAGASAIALAFPGTFLDAMWRLNPRAEIGFASMGSAAILLMIAVSTSCLAAALGLWRARRWGYWLAITLLVVNLVGDLANSIFGSEPRALVGVPIVAVILWLLTRPQVRGWFDSSR